MISLDELENGDRLVLEDQFGYREEILKSGGSYGHKKGRVFGFTRDTGHIDKIKVPDDFTREVLYIHGGLSYELRSKVYIPGEAGYDD